MDQLFSENTDAVVFRDLLLSYNLLPNRIPKDFAIELVKSKRKNVRGQVILKVICLFHPLTTQVNRALHFFTDNNDLFDEVWDDLNTELSPQQQQWEWHSQHFQKNTFSGPGATDYVGAGWRYILENFDEIPDMATISKEGNTILHQHIGTANLNALAVLLENCPSELINHQNKIGDTAVHVLLKSMFDACTY